MFEALKKSREEGRSWDFSREDNPRCPHCGKTYSIDEHEAYELYDASEGVHEIECYDCEKEFTVSVSCSFSFSTDDADEYVDEDEDEDG